MKGSDSITFNYFPDSRFSLPESSVLGLADHFGRGWTQWTNKLENPWSRCRCAPSQEREISSVIAVGLESEVLATAGPSSVCLPSTCSAFWGRARVGIFTE